MSAVDRVFRAISVISQYHWRKGVTHKEAARAFRTLTHLGLSLEPILGEHLTVEILTAKSYKDLPAVAKKAYDSLLEQIIEETAEGKLIKDYLPNGAKCFRSPSQTPRQSKIRGNKPYHYPWYNTAQAIRAHVAEICDPAPIT